MANVLERRCGDLETLYWLAEDLDEFLSNIALGGMSDNLRYMRRGRTFLRREYGAFVKGMVGYVSDGPEDHVLAAYRHAMWLGKCARNYALSLVEDWEDGCADEEETLDVIYENLIFHDDEFEEAA